MIFIKLKKLNGMHLKISKNKRKMEIKIKKEWLVIF